MQPVEQIPEPGELFLKPHHYPVYIRIATLIIFISVMVAIYQSKNSIKAVKRYHQARDFAREGNLTLAKSYYETALDFSPESVDIKIDLAITCFEKKDTLDDIEGLNYLRGIRFSEKEWQDVRAVLPQKYFKYFNY